MGKYSRKGTEESKVNSSARGLSESKDKTSVSAKERDVVSQGGLESIDDGCRLLSVGYPHPG